MNISKDIEEVMRGEYLEKSQISEIVNAIRDERIDELQFVAFLAAMETRNRIKGIDSNEIIYFVESLRMDDDKQYPYLCTAGTGGYLLFLIGTNIERKMLHLSLQKE